MTAEEYLVERIKKLEDELENQKDELENRNQSSGVTVCLPPWPMLRRKQDEFRIRRDGGKLLIVDEGYAESESEFKRFIAEKLPDDRQRSVIIDMAKRVIEDMKAGKPLKDAYDEAERIMNSIEWMFDEEMKWIDEKEGEDALESFSCEQEGDE